MCQQKECEFKMTGWINKITELKRLCEAGDIQSIIDLGKSYMSGAFGIIDAKEAVNLFNRAADLGSIDGMRCLADIACEDRDIESQIVWLRRAAKAGCELSALELANLLMENLFSGQQNNKQLDARNLLSEINSLYYLHLSKTPQFSDEVEFTARKNFGFLILNRDVRGDASEGEFWISSAQKIQQDPMIMRYFARKEERVAQRFEKYTALARYSDFPDSDELEYVNEAKRELSVMAFKHQNIAPKNLPYVYFLKEAAVSGCGQCALLASIFLLPENGPHIPDWLMGHEKPSHAQAYGFSMLSRVLGAGYIHISNYKLVDSQGTIEKIAKEAINDADFIQSTVKIIRLFAESGLQDAELRDIIFGGEFGEIAEEHLLSREL
jgi:hypothetical protein